MEYGIRAGLKLLQNYASKYGLKTIQDIVHKFAPPFENDTDNYIITVCQRTGFNSTQQLDLHDEDTLVKLAEAIVYVEQGTYINPIRSTYHKYFA